MNLKIKITTPKGQAKKTEARLRSFLIGHRQLNAVYTNEDDNEIYWEVETDIRNAMKIQRNVTSFDMIIKNLFENKLVKKLSDKKLTPEDSVELKNMLMNHTTVEIIKAAIAEELVENNKTYWQRIKETFKKN